MLENTVVGIITILIERHEEAVHNTEVSCYRLLPRTLYIIILKLQSNLNAKVKLTFVVL